MRIECPHCATSYTSERCGINPETGTFFTVICGLCGESFDGDMVETSTVVTAGVPASRLHRWTGGYLGAPAVPEVWQTELHVFTRKR